MNMLMGEERALGTMMMGDGTMEGNVGDDDGDVDDDSDVMMMMIMLLLMMVILMVLMASQAKAVPPTLWCSGLLRRGCLCYQLLF